MSDLNEFMSNEPDGEKPDGSNEGSSESAEGKEPVKALKPFMAQFPDKYKRDERLAQFDNFGGVLDSYFDVLSKVPTFPEKPEEYEIPEMSKSVNHLDGFDKAFAVWAHTAKLSKDQAKAFYDQWIDGLNKADEARKTSMDTASKALRDEWKGDYDKNVEFALRSAERYGGKELSKLLTDTGLRENPLIIKTFSKIGFDMAEDTAHRGNITEKQQEERKILDDAYPSMEGM